MATLEPDTALKKRKEVADLVTNFTVRLRSKEPET